MKATPLFLGACALASVAGAVGGATTNTTPIQNAAIGMDMLPERHIAFDSADSGLPQVAPPDHYAMITPQGRIEAAELSTRGLYSQRRFGWNTAQYDTLPETAFTDETTDETAGSNWSDDVAPAPAINAPPIPAPVEPLRLDEPAATSNGQPRVIDVAVALASER